MLQKIPSTWADASSKVNIDLDGLGMKKKPQKQFVPMNQMATSLSTTTVAGMCRIIYMKCNSLGCSFIFKMSIPGRGLPFDSNPYGTKPAHIARSKMPQQQAPPSDILDLFK